MAIVEMGSISYADNDEAQNFYFFIVSSVKPADRSEGRSGLAIEGGESVPYYRYGGSILTSTAHWRLAVRPAGWPIIPQLLHSSES
ncbi:hypothetical protein M514_23289 [Trichuris suis]|uniref:Uncharacterized protein n=1 Tax=Trichuris suis TaxID=68888 RepID=A0A085N529_9BILA|nr:hypothetical protein M514_23289 [Trichuris suis]